MLFIESSCSQSSHIVLQIGVLAADIPDFAKHGDFAAPGLFGRGAMPYSSGWKMAEFGVRDGPWQAS